MAVNYMYARYVWMEHGHRNKKYRLANEINVAWLIVLPNLENYFHQICRFPVLLSASSFSCIIFISLLYLFRC